MTATPTHFHPDPENSSAHWLTPAGAADVGDSSSGDGLMGAAAPSAALRKAELSGMSWLRMTSSTPGMAHRPNCRCQFHGSMATLLCGLSM